METVTRNQQKEENTWDISKIFKNINEFNNGLKTALKLSTKILKYKGCIGNLNSDESDKTQKILSLLQIQDTLFILYEKLSSYSFMKTSEDGGDKNNQILMANFVTLSSKINDRLSFIIPELLTNTDEYLTFISKDKTFKDYSVFFKKLIRSKKHILSEKEERIMTLQSDISSLFSRCFDDLTDVDFEFGMIDDKPLTNSTFSFFLHSENPTLREKAYNQYYKKFDENKNCIARLYEGVVRKTLFTTKVRGYKDITEKLLFDDKVDKKVLLSLFEVAHTGHDALKKFYKLKKESLKLDVLKHCDVYAPFNKYNSEYKVNYSYDEAVNIVLNALSPLGDEYVSVLKKGLTTERWVDRYENKGKSSGAYSLGVYKTLPYILLNYKSDSIRDVFTLAHEAGHSMHSYYSAKNNPYSCYDYSIMEAEVASTFNEMMLYDYLFKNSKSDEEKYTLLLQQADDILATFFRQTMFAEFEYNVMSKAEKGEALTLSMFTNIYKELQDLYLPEVEISDYGRLECLRIPHFYRPFYVYKYATGISASYKLMLKVKYGDKKDKEKYLNFLKSGGRYYPIENLKKAGVDLTTPLAFKDIVKLFSDLVSLLS